MTRNSTDTESGGDNYSFDTIDHIILDTLQEGRAPQPWIASFAPYPRHQFRRHFDLLKMMSWVTNLHEQTAFYRLNKDQRPEDVVGSHLEALRDLIERGDFDPETDDHETMDELIAERLNDDTDTDSEEQNDD